MKYIPTKIIKTFKDIDFQKLWDEGKRIILTDLDNTLVSYFKKDCPEDLTALNQEIRKIGFKIYIISNNNKRRIERFIEGFPVIGYVSNAMKPWRLKTLAYLHHFGILKEECVFIGDQILTDIKLANKLSIDSILVKSKSRASEKWYTTINRKREKAILKRIKKIDPEKYLEIERLNDNE